MSLAPEATYVTFSSVGTIMNDGAPVHRAPDSMVCFENDLGHYVLIRNHETDPEIDPPSPFPSYAYDPACNGGTTTVILDKNLNLVEHFTSLTGTSKNCSGGRTTWNTWLTCEETNNVPASLIGFTNQSSSFLTKTWLCLRG